LVSNGFKTARRVIRGVDTHDIIGVGGFFALVYGVAQVSAPAAWITAGLLLVALWLWPLLRRNVKG
jgi:hypothetical protein